MKKPAKEADQALIVKTQTDQESNEKTDEQEA